MWEEIIQMKAKETYMEWCMIGDFNAVTKIEDRKGLNSIYNNKKEVQKFNEFISEVEVLEV